MDDVHVLDRKVYVKNHWYNNGFPYKHASIIEIFV